MPFNSYAFVAGFLPAALLGFFLLGRSWHPCLARAWLLAVSLTWYAVADPRQVALLAASGPP